MLLPTPAPFFHVVLKERKKCRNREKNSLPGRKRTERAAFKDMANMRVKAEEGKKKLF